MKKQGKVKSIPVTKEQVTEGMQVNTPNGIGKILGIYGLDEITSVSVGLIESKRVEDYQLYQLKTLVVEYEVKDGLQLIDTVTNKELRTIQQLPLKYSQWQSSIDNGEVDSDKVVEFEIVVRDTKVNYIEVAKIIPQKKRMYTQEEVDYLINSERCKAVQQVLNQKRMYSEEDVHNLMMQAWIHGEANKDAHYSVRENWIIKTLKEQ